MLDVRSWTSVLGSTAERATKYLEGLDQRGAAPTPGALARLDALDGPTPERGEDPADVLRLLDEVGSPATVASAGGRYFGFV
ncbi:MAG: aspartate aminotransferase family protein, partial [Chloroflexi bacterium]|nr:aspartate aminotransferase family protein [Chloroflexota bacterium]